MLNFNIIGYGKYFRMRGNAFHLLDGILVPSKIIEIENYCDINKYYRPQFREAHDVYIKDCHPNLLKYYLNSKTFPKVKNIYLDTEIDHYQKFDFDKDINIHVTDYCNFNGRKVKMIKRAEMKRALLSSLNQIERRFVE